MATKKKTFQNNQFDIEFVNYELNKEQKEEARRYELDTERAFQLLEELCGDGYKISWKYDERNKCFQASLTSAAKGTTEKQRCMVSRGPDLYSAIRVSLWKHYVLFDGDWASNAPTDDEWSQWG